FFPQHFLGLRGMPRRYIDYRDTFAPWHMVSRVGSLVSLFRVLHFILILVEGLTSQRSLVGNSYQPTRLEWKSRLYPGPYHNRSENPFIFKWGAEKIPLRERFSGRLRLLAQLNKNNKGVS
ncbi:MAG: hypothetical protein ABW116_10770, partial [Candidatus Sedimenticola sp. 20ELBAFRAG]